MKRDSGSAVAAGTIEMAAVYGSRGLVLIDGWLRLVWSMGVGMPARTMVLTPPPGRVVALDASGPSVLLADGRLLMWMTDGSWGEAGNVLAEPTE